MPELVGRQARLTDRGGGRIEPVPARVAVSQRCAARSREHEVIATFIAKVKCKIVDQDARDRHRAGLVRLGRAPNQATAVDLGHRLGHDQPPAQQIHAPDTQRRQLRPAKTAVGKHENGEPVTARCVRELLDLSGGQVPARTLAGTREIDAESWVGRQPPVADSQGQHTGQHAVHFRT